MKAYEDRRALLSALKVVLGLNITVMQRQRAQQSVYVILILTSFCSAKSMS
jgi:hypothetical protein